MSNLVRNVAVVALLNNYAQGTKLVQRSVVSLEENQATTAIVKDN